MPNQAKKQRKKAIHVMWNARIGGEEKSSRRIRSALPTDCMTAVSPNLEDRRHGPVKEWDCRLAIRMPCRATLVEIALQQFHSK